MLFVQFLKMKTSPLQWIIDRSLLPLITIGVWEGDEIMNTSHSTDYWTITNRCCLTHLTYPLGDISRILGDVANIDVIYHEICKVYPHSIIKSSWKQYPTSRKVLQWIKWQAEDSQSMPWCSLRHSVGPNGFHLKKENIESIHLWKEDNLELPYSLPSETLVASNNIKD